MIRVQHAPLLALFLLPAACAAPTRTASDSAGADLAAAEARLAAEPDDEDAHVWVGRRLGYLGRFEEAIEAFTRGLELHPRSAKLLRFRGHRYITLRRFDLAIADLERADALARLAPDEVEPDGQPNAAGIPLTTLRSNIDYHLALALYLARDFERALGVYRAGEERGRANPDRAVSHGYWTWLTLQRLGRRAEARALLESLDLAAPVLENDAYRDLLRLFRGELDERRLLAGHGPGSVQYATRAYGAGMARHLRGDAEGARHLWRTVVAAGPPGAFGTIAAEVELAGEAESRGGAQPQVVSRNSIAPWGSR